MLDHIGAQIIAERIGVPVNAREELLHAVWRGVAGRLGEVPAVLPLQGGQQALKISQGASARLRTPEPRGNPPGNRLQLLSPVLGFAPARHGFAPPLQEGQPANPGCSTSTTVASILPVWSSPGRVWEGRSVDVCCGLVGLAGGVGARTGGAQGADRTGVRQGRNTGDRWSFSRRRVVGGRAQNRLAPG